MEAIAVIAGIVVLIWGAVAVPARRTAGRLSGRVAGRHVLQRAVLQDRAWAAAADGRPRCCWCCLVGQYVVWRRWGLADPKPLGKPEILLLAFLATLVVSTFSSDWEASNYQPVSWLILYYLMPAVVYWIARQAKLSERAVLALFGCLAIFGVYLAVTSLAEYFQAWWLVFPKYIATTAADANAEFVGRGRGPLLHPIGNGVLLAVCLGSALMWWPRLNRVGQLLLVPITLLFLAAIYCTLTRSVWMGGMLTLALAVGLALPWNWRLPLLGGGLLAAAAAWRNAVGQTAGVQARQGPGGREDGRIGRAAPDHGRGRLAHVPRSAAVRLRLFAVQDRAPELCFRPLDRSAVGAGPRLHPPQRGLLAVDRDGAGRAGVVCRDAALLGARRLAAVAQRRRCRSGPGSKACCCWSPWASTSSTACSTTCRWCRWRT